MDKMKFYTNLYRCYAAKQTWNDVDGKYMDPCEKVQQMPEGQRYLWWRFLLELLLGSEYYLVSCFTGYNGKLY